MPINIFVLKLSLGIFFSLSVMADSCSDGITLTNHLPIGNVAFTFDDGPDPQSTPKILDILKKHHIKAAFFVIGAKAKKYPELVKRIRDEGHLVGNHSLTHQNFSVLDKPQTYKQILKSAEMIHSITEQKVDVFRFPEGKANCFGKQLLASNGFQYIGWDIDPCDWSFSDHVITDDEAKVCQFSKSERKDFVTTTLARTAKMNGGVLLLHDIHQNTADNLESLILGLKKKRYRFAIVPDQRLSQQSLASSLKQGAN
jgi:peptidoglycan-N-acetylglucosamine deacetylase